jgi:hypothetical protein
MWGRMRHIQVFCLLDFSVLLKLADKVGAAIQSDLGRTKQRMTRVQIPCALRWAISRNVLAGYRHIDGNYRSHCSSAGVLDPIITYM